MTLEQNKQKREENDLYGNYDSERTELILDAENGEPTRRERNYKKHKIDRNKFDAPEQVTDDDLEGEGIHDQDLGVEYTRGKLTLEKTETRNGEKCAVIKSVGEAVGAGATGVGYKVKWEATPHVSLEKKFVTEMKVAESFTVSGGGKFESLVKARPAK